MLTYARSLPTIDGVPPTRSPVDPVGRQLAALADPTRRAVYEIVRAAPSSVAAVTDQLPISQPAVSQHLKVLAEAGLVAATPEGARRIYRADGHRLAPLRAWVDRMWDDVLDAFVDAARAERATGTPGLDHDPDHDPDHDHDQQGRQP